MLEVTDWMSPRGAVAGDAQPGPLVDDELGALASAALLLPTWFPPTPLRLDLLPPLTVAGVDLLMDLVGAGTSIEICFATPPTRAPAPPPPRDAELAALPLRDTNVERARPSTTTKWTMVGVGWMLESTWFLFAHEEAPLLDDSGAGRAVALDPPSSTLVTDAPRRNEATVWLSMLMLGVAAGGNDALRLRVTRGASSTSCTRVLDAPPPSLDAAAPGCSVAGEPLVLPLLLSSLVERSTELTPAPARTAAGVPTVCPAAARTWSAPRGRSVRGTKPFGTSLLLLSIVAVAVEVVAEEVLSLNLLTALCCAA